MRRSYCVPVRVLMVALALLVVSSLWAMPAKHVIIISLDGGRPDVILTSDTMYIHKLAAEGAYTWWAQTVDPSITLVSHSSMLTGCLPAKHGITWNDTFRPEAGYVKTTTCFELAKAAGLSTAMFSNKAKLRHIAKPGTVDHYEDVAGGAIGSSTAAAEYWTLNKPSLMFVHHGDPDAAGHTFGWGSREHHLALETCDRAVGILLNAVLASDAASQTVIIVTADHGGHLTTHGSTDPRDMTIPWVCWGPGMIRPGQVEAPVSTCDTAATALVALGLAPDPDWDGKPVAEVFVPEEAPVAAGG
jgi:predicted AlkP superfamily pyrophosphatase or phosphodiesterase